MKQVSPLHNAIFRKLFAAQVIALVGTGLSTVALTLLAYDLAGKNAASVLGIALAFKMVAYVFFPLSWEDFLTALYGSLFLLAWM